MLTVHIYALWLTPAQTKRAYAVYVIKMVQHACGLCSHLSIGKIYAHIHIHVECMHTLGFTVYGKSWLALYCGHSVYLGRITVKEKIPEAQASKPDRKEIDILLKWRKKKEKKKGKDEKSVQWPGKVLGRG